MVSMPTEPDEIATPGGVSGRLLDEARSEIAGVREALRGLLAFYDAALGLTTLDPGDVLISDGTRLHNVVSLIEKDESFAYDDALDAAEPYANAARKLLGGESS